jgi:hypothetical protein
MLKWDPKEAAASTSPASGRKKMANILVSPLTEGDISERVLILKKLRQALLSQRRKFRTYLQLLEKEKTAILADDVAKLEFQIDIEHTIVKEIFTLQRAIVPLQELFRREYPDSEESITKLEGSLIAMRGKILERNENNRHLLKEKMAILRQEIKNLRRGFKRPSPFNRVGVPSLIDLTT